mgnify:CR=1 FL=1
MFVARRAAVPAGALIFMLASTASGQNTGGVFGPVVNDGHRSAQFRIAYDPDSEDFANRSHYQHSLDGRLMWRAIVQARDPGGADFQFDFVQGELFWQLTPDDSRWQRGLRFDVRLRDSDRPGTIGVNWMNQFELAPEVRARANLLTAVDIGQNGRDGVQLQFRGQLARLMGGSRQFGLELFSAIGSTSDIPGFNQQRHQLGPFFSFSPGKRLNIYTSALFGVSDSAPDTNLGIWFTAAM